MAREPQRREQPAPLGAAIVPLERALRARAEALDLEAEHLFALGDAVTNPATLQMIATEFRALADELAHW